MKKNLWSRLLSVALVLVLALVCLRGGTLTAFAAETAQDGLEVTLVTDKSTYDPGETIVATLTVKNTNDFAVLDVSLESLVPEGYILADGDKTVMHLDTLGAGETVTLTVRLVPEQTGNTEPATDPTTPPADTPETGDNSIWHCGWSCWCCL